MVRKINKTEKESCEYLFKEIKYAKERLDEVLFEVQRWQDNIHQLESLAEMLICPVEDLSPEAIKENQRLADELKKEIT